MNTRLATTVFCVWSPGRVAPSTECREWFEEYELACKRCEPILRRLNDTGRPLEGSD